MHVTQMSAATPRKRMPRTEGDSYQKPLSMNLLSGKFGKILSGFEKDDYILLGIIAVLIWEGCDDYILLAALGYLFFMGVIT